MKKKNLYILNTPVKAYDLVIANTTDHNLTEGKVYAVLANEEWNGWIYVKNDKGGIEEYSKEWFCPYDGETVL